VTKRRLLMIGASAIAALLTVTACGSTDRADSSGSTSTGVPGPSSSVSATGAHNQADVTFAQHMIPHHQQAIQMSDVILAKQGIDPRVVALANKIKAAQGPEIQQMQSWLSQWGQPTTMPGGMPSESVMPTHRGAPAPGGMTGTMSEQDMAALQNAQGVEASKLYLNQMIQHHQGAIAMAQDEIKSGQYPQAVTLGQSIATSQQQEINTMQSLLASL
jgi:uncharacterized protein (DUF305 family)